MLAPGFLSDWQTVTGWTLLHSLWQIGLLAILLKGLVVLLRHQDARLRYGLACVTLLLALLLPVGTALLHHQVGSIAPFSSATSAGHTLPANQAKPLPLPTQTFEPQTSPPWHQGLISRLESQLHWVVGFWEVGVLLMSIWHLGGFLRLRQWQRRYTQQAHQDLQRRIKALATEMGFRPRVMVRTSSLLKSPAVVGWIKPTILFPLCALSSLPADDIEALLLHELAHIRRYDYLVNMLQICTEIIGFYHPALWWINRSIRREREFCCDEIAAGRGPRRKAYAQTLLSLAELRLNSPQPALGATDYLQGRIYRLLGFKSSVPGRFHHSIVPTALLLAALPFVLPLWAETSSSSSNWRALFPDHSLTGWQERGKGKAQFSIQDDCIVGTSQGHGALFLCSETHYSDFELEFEVWMDPNLNGGVQFRSQVYQQDTPAPWPPKKGKKPYVYRAGTVFGYQVEITGEGNKHSGSVWDEGRKSTWLTNTAKNPVTSQAWQDHQWNHYRVLCQGDHIRTWVNGILCSDLHDDSSQSGFLALQVFNRSTHEPLSIRWRNLRIREL